jgi:hypothetical protein
MNTEATHGANLLTGAEILVRCLAEEGVEHVFGYPGGAVLYIYDAIFKQDKFQHILVRHEQAAIHAADAYSRSSKSWCSAGNVRSGRDQCRYRPFYRLHGFHPYGGDLGPGA